MCSVSVAVNRVPVLDGHTAHVFCKLRTPATHLDAVRALRDFRPASPPHDLALVIGVHNGIRGAAGACLANAELCLAQR